MEPSRSSSPALVSTERAGCLPTSPAAVRRMVSNTAAPAPAAEGEAGAGTGGLALPEVRSAVHAAELYKVMHCVLLHFPALCTLLPTYPPAAPHLDVGPPAPLTPLSRAGTLAVRGPVHTARPVLALAGCPPPVACPVLLVLDPHAARPARAIAQAAVPAHDADPAAINTRPGLPRWNSLSRPRGEWDGWAGVHAPVLQSRRSAPRARARAPAPACCVARAARAGASMRIQSDNDDSADLHIQQINPNASREETMAALKASQLSVMKLLAENRALQKENSELRAATSKKHRKGAERDVFGYKPHIVTLAKKFLFTRALVVDVAMFRPKPPLPSGTPEEQFLDDTAYRQSITSALYEDIPEKFHDALNAQTYASFAKDFVHEHGEGRSTLISVIRKNLPIILKGLNIDSDILTTASADRSNNPALTGLLRFPTERKATLYGPVLFPGPTQNMNELFTGEVVMKVHRLMFFGPKSLVPRSKPAANSNGIKMGLKEVTEESISAAGTLTRFVLSPDKEWASTGAISGIEWEADYRAYHKLLACNRHLPHVKKIFKKIHAFVFAGVDVPSSAANNPDSDSDGETEDAIVDAMRRFALGIDSTSDLEEDAVQSMVDTPVEPISIAAGPNQLAEEPVVEPQVEPAPAPAAQKGKGRVRGKPDLLDAGGKPLRPTLRLQYVPGLTCGLKIEGELVCVVVKDKLGTHENRCESVFQAGTEKVFAVLSTNHLSSSLRVEGVVAVPSTRKGFQELSVIADPPDDIKLPKASTSNIANIIAVDEPQLNSGRKITLSGVDERDENTVFCVASWINEDAELDEPPLSGWYLTILQEFAKNESVLWGAVAIIKALQE
ncbi:hypothetical protein B0H15DRAFT_956411 [Mycena belliarum]|uniref:Uncharacterized protein n=1 Tax=Mycena belliarum TaxID=1033014 RepID=A0AAD6TPM8_9AGAR|nr:hypothetical protein B0H15DRAFT_956411 [Mycena belliae]